MVNSKLVRDQERLVHDVALASLHYYLAHLLRLLPEPDALFERWTVLAADKYGVSPRERNIHVLQILSATHGGIHVLTHEDDNYRNEGIPDAKATSMMLRRTRVPQACCRP